MNKEKINAGIDRMAEEAKETMNLMSDKIDRVNESAENSRVKLLQIRVLLHGSNKLLDIGFLLLLLLQVLAQDFCH